MSNTYRGPWADTPVAAGHQALADKGVDVGEYVTLPYSTGDVVMVPVSGEGMEVHIEIVYSESRDQYRAILRRVNGVDRS